MDIDYISLPKQKSWGLIPHPLYDKHFYTGYVGFWETYQQREASTLGPEESMQLKQNVIIGGGFAFDSMSRGRSAANFSGHFRGHPDVSYEFGMQGMMQLIELVQAGKFVLIDGYLAGQWTLAKQGASIFLKPYFEN